jgi:hypothetical protein
MYGCIAELQETRACQSAFVSRRSALLGIITYLTVESELPDNIYNKQISRRPKPSLKELTCRPSSLINKALTLSVCPTNCPAPLRVPDAPALGTRGSQRRITRSGVPEAKSVPWKSVLANLISACSHDLGKRKDSLLTSAYTLPLSPPLPSPASPSVPIARLAIGAYGFGLWMSQTLIWRSRPPEKSNDGWGLFESL